MRTTIHCNNEWIANALPGMFKSRHIGQLTDTSTGIIAAFSCYDNRLSMLDIGSLSERYKHVVIYYCEPFMTWPNGKPILKRVLKDSPDNVTICTDLIFDRNPRNHIYVGNWWMVHQNYYAECCWAPELLAELRDDMVEKPYFFDALLGAQRPHRDLIHSRWRTSTCKDKILLTYHGPNAAHGIWHFPFQAEPVQHVYNSDSAQLTTTLWTMMPLSPGGEPNHKVGAQHILPVKIYNDSWYSIIAEGFTDHRGTRLTEKTAKALVAQRLFVYFGGPRDLERMRRLGFQTFGHVIDESYDSIENDEQRWQEAWRQVKWLCNQDPVTILESTREQRAHNQQVFLQTDWYAGLRDHVSAILAKY